MIAAALFLAADLATTPALSADAIADALQTAQSKGAVACYPIGIVGCISTPYSRAVGAALDAVEKYKTPTAEDAAAAAGGPEVRFFAFSRSLGRVIASVEAVIIMPRGAKDRSAAIQPESAEESHDTFKNGFGAVFNGTSLAAVFPPGSFQEGADIHIVYDRSIGWCKDCSNPFHVRDVVRKGMSRAEIESLLGPPAPAANVRLADGSTPPAADVAVYGRVSLHFKDGKLKEVPATVEAK